MNNRLTRLLYDRTGAFRLTVLTSPLFMLGLFIKMFAAPVFASGYFESLFIPFLKFFALSGTNPYIHFETFGILNAFPYPAMMLYIMALPGILLSPFLDANIFHVTSFELFIYRLPILLADITILIILARWLKGHERLVLILYWLSPILFYINYLQGQLDVIPISLVFLFLHFLFKERWTLAYILLGLAVAAKLHILILVPLTAVYIWRKRHKISHSFWFLAVAGSTFFVVNLPYIFTTGFQTLVFKSPVQFKIFDLQLSFGNEIAILVIPFTYTAILLYSATFRFFNRDTFVMLLGFSFGILTLLVAPMPGWYYWIIPFFIYFYAKNQNASRSAFWTINVLYFSYFLLTKESDFIHILKPILPQLLTTQNAFAFLLEKGVNASLISNTVFSMLQAALLVNVLWIFRRGVEESKKVKLYNTPYIIGVSGDSGSGKSTFATLLEDIFHPSETAIVAGDALHKWERGHEMWHKYTHLDPRANELHNDVEHIRSLQNGENIFRRMYDHHSGKFTTPSKLGSKKLVIFEGLHSFFLTQMRTMLDLKVFIMPEEQLRTHWKVCRDMKERGYTKEKVLEQLQKREGDSKKYITVQEAYADITISLQCKQELGDRIGTSYNPETLLELKCENTINLDAFVTALSKHMNVDHFFDEQRQLIQLYGQISADDVRKLSYQLVPDLYDVSLHEPRWSGDYSGVVQLFVCSYIFSTLKRTSHGT